VDEIVYDLANHMIYMMTLTGHFSCVLYESQCLKNNADIA